MREERATGAGSAAGSGGAGEGSAHLIGADLWPETAAAEGLVRVVEIEKEREGEGAPAPRWLPAAAAAGCWARSPGVVRPNGLNPPS